MYISQPNSSSIQLFPNESDLFSQPYNKKCNVWKVVCRQLSDAQREFLEDKSDLGQRRGCCGQLQRRRKVKVEKWQCMQRHGTCAVVNLLLVAMIRLSLSGDLPPIMHVPHCTKLHNCHDGGEIIMDSWKWSSNNKREGGRNDEIHETIKPNKRTNCHVGQANSKTVRRFGVR